MATEAARKVRDEAEIIRLIQAGFEALSGGDLAAAERGADGVLALEPDQVDALSLKGQIAHHRENLNAAQDFYERAILARPDFIDPYLKLLALLFTTDRNNDALAVWRMALAHVKPGPDTLVDLCGPMVGNFAAEVREVLWPAMQAGPPDVRLWRLYQQVLHRLLVDGPEYDAFLEGMRERFPDAMETAFAAAMALGYRNRVDEADAAYEALRKKYPDLLFFDGELARAYRDEGRLEQAQAQAERFVQLFPGNPDHAFMLSELKLFKGEIGEGLRLNEARFGREHGFNWKYLPVPAWQGEPVDGQRIIVFEEQGLGDSIMFGRYLPLLLERGARIRYVGRQAMYSVFAGQPRLRHAEIFARTTTFNLPEDTKYYVSAMSVAHFLGITTATAGEGSVYLRADPYRAAEWRARLPRDGRPLVGLAWAANLDTGNGVARSVPPAMMPALLNLPGIAFVSLQMPASLDDPHRELYALRPDITDFGDTMALIDCMDLVVCVDTSVAHLAASMGKPTIVLSKFTPEWRWQGPPGGAPYWYPQVEVIRQARPRDWDSAIDALAARLRKLVSAGA